MKNPIRFCSSALLLVILLVSGGCTSFKQDWTKAAAQPAAADDLLGRWQGTWKSDADGHNDKLRCVVTQKADGIYQARFEAKYRKYLTFGYTVPLQVTKTDGRYDFTGRADLGWYAGGLYHYDGHADGTNFASTYRCKYDHGTFQMGRP